MLICINNINSSLFRIKTLKAEIDKRIKKEEEFTDETIKNYSNLYVGILLDLGCSYSEATFILSGNRHNETMKYEIILDRIIESLKKKFISMDILIEDIEQYVSINTKDYNESDDDIGYVISKSYSYSSPNSGRSTDDIYTQILGSKIKLKKDRNIKILDAYPLNGNTSCLKESIESKNVTYYGINISEAAASKYRSQYDRLAMGSIHGSNISNEVFDVALLNINTPMTMYSSSKNPPRLESAYITNITKYIRPGGYMALIIPYYKLTKELIIKICRIYENIEIRKNKFSEQFKNTGAILIVGKKKDEASSKEDINIDDYTKLRYCFNQDNITAITSDSLLEMILPEQELEVKLFRGPILDVEQAKEFVCNSTAINSFWSDQEKEYNNNKDTSPLLPFNTGQIGLVLTSGCLDGIVDEENGHFHIIKGRVVKDTDVTRETNLEATESEITETTSNKVEINVLLPDGTHKVLA